MKRNYVVGSIVVAAVSAVVCALYIIWNEFIRRRGEQNKATITTISRANRHGSVLGVVEQHTIAINIKT